MSTVANPSTQQYSSYTSYTNGTNTSTSKNNAAQNSSQTSNSSQNRYEDSYESSAGNKATTYSQPTGVRGYAEGYEPKQSSGLSPEAQANLKNMLAAENRKWELGKELGIDFSMSNAPTNAEDKKKWNEAVMKMAQEDVFKASGAQLPPILGSLNRIEGSDWMIADGAEALIEHDVLGILESNNATHASMYNEYGHVNQAINEYGYAASMPGKYKDLSYHTITLTDQFGNESEARLLGMDGGQTYAPEIKYKDALGLGGMSLDDRKTFMSTAQNILNQVAPGLDVRQLNFTVGFKTDEDMRNNNYSLFLDSPSGRIADEREAIENALNADKSLVNMLVDAKSSGNKSAGEYTISVLDEAGNALAKNEIILTAGGKSVRTTVDTIDGMDHKQVLNFINNGTVEKTEKAPKETTAQSSTETADATSQSAETKQAESTQKTTADGKPVYRINIDDPSQNTSVDPEGLGFDEAAVRHLLSRHREEESAENVAKKGFSLQADQNGNYVLTVNEGLIDGRTGKEVGLISDSSHGQNTKYLKFQDFLDPSKLDASLGYEAVNGYLTQLVEDIRSGTANYRPDEFYNARNTGAGGSQKGGMILFNVRLV